MRHLAYLFVLAGCLAAALWLEPVLKVNVLRRWRRLLLTLLPVVVVFVLWDLAAIAAGHWTFDPAQTTGIVLPGGLPLDEVLFFLVVPVCAILGFEAVRAVLRQAGRRRVTYTAAALLGVLAALVVDLLVLRTRLVTRAVFWATYPIVIVFQLLSNGILTGRHIVVYDPAAILGLRDRVRAGRGPVLRVRAGAAHACRSGSGWAAAACSARRPRARAAGCSTGHAGRTASDRSAGPVRARGRRRLGQLGQHRPGLGFDVGRRQRGQRRRGQRGDPLLGAGQRAAVPDDRPQPLAPRPRPAPDRRAGRPARRGRPAGAAAKAAATR